MVLTDVSIGYATHAIASGISFSLRRGTLNCLIGPNGCGKSTLLRTIAFLQKPLAGNIFFEGQNLALLDRKQLAQTVGIVLTGRIDAQHLTAGELAATGRMPYTGFFGTLSSEDKEIVRRAMALTGITHLAERAIGTLSDGEYQKAVIAKTLAQETPVILLDEPTAFLDYAGKVDLMFAIKKLCRDERKTVLMSTHDVNLALRLADEIFLFSEGKIRQSKQESDVRQFVGNRAAAFL
ncbi:MAG: ABC transporter ATP-binding protein [Prevotella sp.]|nr:ABC transporter ATP-binding protein [Prevotella sp.]